MADPSGSRISTTMKTRTSRRLTSKALELASKPSLAARHTLSDAAKDFIKDYYDRYYVASPARYDALLQEVRKLEGTDAVQLNQVKGVISAYRAMHSRNSSAGSSEVADKKPRVKRVVEIPVLVRSKGKLKRTCEGRNQGETEIVPLRSQVDLTGDAPLDEDVTDHSREVSLLIGSARSSEDTEVAGSSSAAATSDEEPLPWDYSCTFSPLDRTTGQEQYTTSDIFSYNTASTPNTDSIHSLPKSVDDQPFVDDTHAPASSQTGEPSPFNPQGSTRASPRDASNADLTPRQGLPTPTPSQTPSPPPAPSHTLTAPIAPLPNPSQSPLSLSSEHLASPPTPPSSRPASADNTTNFSHFPEQTQGLLGAIQRAMSTPTNTTESYYTPSPTFAPSFGAWSSLDFSNMGLNTDNTGNHGWRSASSSSGSNVRGGQMGPAMRKLEEVCAKANAVVGMMDRMGEGFWGEGFGPESEHPSI